LIVKTTLLVRAIEDCEVVVINVSADKDIAKKFQYRGLADTSFSNKEDGVWRFRLVF
jgi:hypothetical protein